MARNTREIRAFRNVFPPKQNRCVKLVDVCSAHGRESIRLLDLVAPQGTRGDTSRWTFLPVYLHHLLVLRASFRTAEGVGRVLACQQELCGNLAEAPCAPELDQLNVVAFAKEAARRFYCV
jgi:hypothetical protein